MSLPEKDLLELLQKLPVQEKREWTFLETIKVAQWETIMANLLAFYFRPEEEHGLGNLFLSSLLSCYEAEGPEEAGTGASWLAGELDLPEVSVQTEVVTSNNKRIDILITSSQWVIAIEFKINHELDNPLGDYVAYVEKEFAAVPEQNRCYIILSPKRKKAVGGAKKAKELGFRQIILSHLIQRVTEELSNVEKLPRASSPQYHYLNDFLNTIQNRRREIDMLENYQKLLEENPELHEKLEAVYTDLQTIEQQFEGRLVQLQEELSGYTLLRSSKQKLFSVMEKKREKRTVKIRLSLKGWSVEYWKGGKKVVPPLVYPYYTDIEELKEGVRRLEEKLEEEGAFT